MPDKFIADFLVRSTVSLTGESKKLSYSAPDGSYEVHISDSAASDDADANLKIQVIFQAEDIDQAEELARRTLRKFLHLLSFVTNSQFRIHRLLRLINWTPGLEQRDAYFYSSAYGEPPIEALSAGLLKTVENLQKEGPNALAEAALMWFANGVGASTMEDQFQYFWFVVETVAVATKSTAKVTDKCQKCGGGLVCSSCGKVSEHRPFEKQAIRALFERLGFSEEVIEFFFHIRNALMHGEAREAIEETLTARQPKFSFAKAVDFIGKAAFGAVQIAFTNGGKSLQPGEMLFPSTYVPQKMTGKFRMTIEVPGDINDPKIEDVMMPTISLVPAEGVGAKPKQ
ncbi:MULTISPECIES: methylamine utilization protein MauJ [unclassified Mesorhizobium]|uniref:methylamine utilization protein MauJ n=1 Tax=unclassified Mesorhizobium TaxID=325217 RepID=UPI0009601B66|nr:MULTISPECIES: methylamine utilization protein MauJ [unclassified Mesorhizobium]MBN9254814.1 hypothetical protein [Mesorhizobium sp.]OJX72048.1 MAG: hypothetical protein BGO93_15525 [Mesorhizobium sp. 65-26]